MTLLAFFAVAWGLFALAVWLIPGPTAIACGVVTLAAVVLFWRAR